MSSSTIKSFKILSLILFTLFPTYLHSQSQINYYVNLPNSISSLGMGDQGVALPWSADAFTYNPANLVYVDGINIKYFQNPFYYWGFRRDPQTSYTASASFDGIGSFGFEYRNWDLGEIGLTTPTSPVVVETVQNFRRSFSIGFARRISDEISIGASARYSYIYLGEVKSKHFSFSLGVNYLPKLFSNRLHLGFSIMNLGAAVAYAGNSFDDEEWILPPPTNLNLGVYALPIKGRYFDIGIQLAFAKQFDEMDGNDQGESSFKTLFTDWDDFPNDAILNAGLAFKWKPLYLGKEIYFIQEMFSGRVSTGSESYGKNMFTHGIKVGFSYKDFEFTAGFSDYWHNVDWLRFRGISAHEFPMETWMFNIKFNNPLSSPKKLEVNNSRHKITLSSGAGYLYRVGKSANPYPYLTIGKNISYYFEAGFYLTEKTALISTFIYDPMLFVYLSDQYRVELLVESFSFASSFRYHPLEFFAPLFVQFGLGINRQNPVINTHPRYYHAVFTHTSIGAQITILDGMFVKPAVNWKLLFMKATGESPRLEGWNLFDFMINIGYEFN